MIEYVIKRDGRKEAFDPEKLNSWGIWASKTIDPKVVNWSSVVLRTVSTLPKQVTTDELQKALIKSCIDMDTYEHNRMAGRLYADALPKQLYKDRKYPHIRDLHKEMSKKGLIRKDINYTDEEYDRINKMIKHKRDIGYTYYSSHHIMSKYAKKDHTTKKTYETPQFVYMRVAMQTFLNYQGEDRMEKLENLYTKLSTRKINIPTPYFANSLTSNPNVASCSVLTTKDEAQSIGIGSLLAYSLTTSGAGLGLHLKTRSLGDAVRGGDIEHSGKVPYYRAYAHSIKSSKQGCYDTETEVLTEKGWRYFKDLTEEDLIVQVHDDLSVEAVKPTRIIEYRHTGKMYKFEGSVDILVTPDHRMVYKSSPDSKEFLEDTADKIDLSETGYLFNSANTTVESEGIPSLDDEDFTWVQPLTHSSSWLRTFLKELVFRNGSNVYTNEREEWIDIVQMAAALCGVYTHKKDKNTIVIYSSEPYTSKVSKEEIDYDDMVYCVEVPSNKIIVRRKGLTLICGNSRGGAGTMYFPFFDPEVITLLNLKNPLSVDSKRLRELDYALLVNKWFVRKAIKKEPVWLFSYKDNPELYELFYDKDPDAFGVAMEEFAQKHKKKVTEVNASEILAACLRQSVETGRVYMMFADEANRRSPYKEKIYSSNLCTEILLPTKPYGSIEDLSSSDVDKGTVAFCNLAGIVVDNIEDDTDYEDSCYYALLMIDEGINNALLPYESLNHSIRYYRSAGVGILGLAHLMAKNKLSYKSREGLTFIHNLAEKHAYYLYKSALRLGKERGNAECMDRTLFPDGWLPIDVMNPNLGDLCDTELKYDWETLRQEIVANGGIRFSTVSTIPPSENCLAFDTKVKTDKGDMTLKEIFDGYVDTSLDEAMKDYSPLTGGKWYELNQPLKALTASGEYHTVPRIWLNGIVKPFKITLEDGTVVKATESHKFLVERDRPTWVPAYDLKVGDNIINIAEE